MRYRKPFTGEQRRAAIEEYDSFRRHLRRLLAEFPPRGMEERQVIARYRRHLREIRFELPKPDELVRADNLNARMDLAKLAMAEYFRLRYFGE